MPKPVVLPCGIHEDTFRNLTTCGGYTSGGSWGTGYGKGTGAGGVAGSGFCHKEDTVSDGYGWGEGDGNGGGISAFSSFSIQGDDNLLGVFYAKASLLGELPHEGDFPTLANLATLVDWLKLAKELGLEAKAVVGKEELYA